MAHSRLYQDRPLIYIYAVYLLIKTLKPTQICFWAGVFHHHPPSCTVRKVAWPVWKWQWLIIDSYELKVRVSQVFESNEWLNAASLWLLLKGQPEEILLGVNTSIMKENISIKCWFANHKILTPPCHEHRGVNFMIDISAKSKPSSKILKPVYQGPGWIQWRKKNKDRQSR